MKLVFATHNSNKAKEIAALLPDHFQILTLKDVQCIDDIPETSETLEGNAELKANYVKVHFGYNCFADDTGLEVMSLNHSPGVRSARYAGEPSNDSANMDLLLKKLEGIDDRRARFRTVICLKILGETHFFEGIVNGNIDVEKKGNEGFGYDPIFIPEGYNISFAQMSLEEKNKISHRARAIKKMVDFLSAI